MRYQLRWRTSRLPFFLLIPLAIFHAGFHTWKPEIFFSNNKGYVNIFANVQYTFLIWKYALKPQHDQQESPLSVFKPIFLLFTIFLYLEVHHGL